MEKEDYLKDVDQLFFLIQLSKDIEKGSPFVIAVARK